MANITIRKDQESRPTLSHAWESRLEPLRLMRDLMGWDPFREMAPLIAQIPGGFAPLFDVKETKDSFVFKADVPGIKETDLEVTLTGNRLTVAGKRETEKQEQADTYYTYERSYGNFTRSFTLPEGVDSSSVHADLNQGVLTVSIQKKPEAQPKRIAVQSAAKRS